MRTIILLLICFPLLVTAQNSVISKISPRLNQLIESSDPGVKLKVWVDLVDKDNSGMLNNPSSFLSQRSIDRRSKRGISINESDLPLWNGYLSEIENAGFRIISKSKWFNSVTLETNSSGLNRLAQMSFVKRLDMVAKAKNHNKFITSDNLESVATPNITTSLDYGSSLAQLLPQQIPAVHDLGFNGSGVYICLMDAGFNNLAHEVYDSLDLVATWDFVNGDPDVGDGGMGSGSHGTATLSVIAGYKPGNLIGTAYKSSYLLAKTENTDTETPAEEDFWISAAELADSIGVDVTSTSLVYLEFDPPFPGYTWQDMNGNTARITIGADLAVAKGISVFNSAGNNGTDPSRNTLAAPADGDSVISIGSITAEGIRSGFSSVGPTVDGRIKPDVMAVGSAVIAAAPGGRTNYTMTSGTSLACPIAAGIAALLLQKNDTLSPMQIREILRNTASQSTSPDRLMGWGIMNALTAINGVPSSIENQEVEIPVDHLLISNYPNPFNPSTTIHFLLPTEKFLTVKLYSTTGSLVKEITKGTFQAGNSKILLDGSGLSSGIYILVVDSGDKIYSHKLSLLK
ncbi:MAG: S8 family peptidase [Ignavibacteriales bacterium]|nr:S8 family peptidase [Ignavibacteriales bacterium]